MPRDDFIRNRDRHAAQAYRAFAAIYDLAIGDAAFPSIRRTFELAVRTYRIRFASAADLGCGTGRFLQYLSRYGVPVWGVDNSPHMLQRAAERVPPASARLLLQDITRLALPEPVDLVTCNFDTLNYLLSEDEVLRAFAGCHASLNESGYFVFDCIAGSRERGGWRRERQAIELPGLVSRWRIAWNPRIGRSVVRMSYRFGGRGAGKCFEELHLQRWYPLRDLARMLSKSGFTIRGFHDAETFLPATFDTFWIKCVAQK